MPFTLLTVVSALAVGYFIWALLDIASLVHFEGVVLRACGFVADHDSYIDHGRLRNSVGLVASLALLFFSLYGEAMSGQAEALDRPVVSRAPSIVETQEMKALDQHLQQTLNMADTEIGIRLRSGRP